MNTLKSKLTGAIQVTVLTAILACFSGFSYAGSQVGIITDTTSSQGLLRITLLGHESNKPECNTRSSFAIPANTPIGKTLQFYIAQGGLSQIGVSVVGTGECSSMVGYEGISAVAIGGSSFDGFASKSDRSRSATGYGGDQAIPTLETAGMSKDPATNNNGVACTTGQMIGLECVTIGCNCKGGHVVSQISTSKTAVNCTATSGSASCSGGTCETGSGQYGFGGCCVCSP